MLKRSLLLVVLCVLVLSVTLVSGQEIARPQQCLATAPTTLVFIQPLANPGVASQPVQVANMTRQSVTFMPWSVKGWVSTDLPASVALGPLGSQSCQVSVDWTRMEPLTPLDQGTIRHLQAILRAQGRNWTPGHGVQGALGAVALDPGGNKPITWILVVAIHSAQ
jgi:hypothetical protein